MTLNAAHLHLMLNHYSIFASFFATLLLCFGLYLKQPGLRFAAYALLISAVPMVIATYLSGSFAEDEIERVAGVMERAVDSHEDAGKVTLAFMLVAGIAATYAAWSEARGTFRRTVQIVVLVFGAGGFCIAGYTALLGGYIHHPEIRPGYQTGVVDR